ncbi:F-box domain-containing protein [Artemisia annua]|uniref:F-box domain-containing protein n=1 Tax=Artemisia annua TaxID=35608 RepID=A0A2U1LWF8_ARTAN|nr:F-box domain-containing protein [Artemisia annua]
MVDVHIPDEVLYNIFARLPGKSLGRLRCISKYWNRLISDPYFAKLLSRPMILLQFQHLYTIENNVSFHNMARSMVKIPSGFGNINIHYVTVVGTFNGIVLLVLEDTSLCTHMILYNPFTQEYNKVPDPPVRPRVRPPQGLIYESYLYIGFGATPDDFKSVRFFEAEESLNKVESYVFSVKKNSWSKPKYFTKNFRFRNGVGMSLNGFLYWTILSVTTTWLILALDIKKMVLSMINIPNTLIY